MVTLIKNSNLCRLRFDSDSKNRLVIKDIANRSILLALADNKGLDSEVYSEWLDKGEAAIEKLNKAEEHLKSSRLKFHQALPHNFIEPDYLTLIESSIQDLQQQLESIKATSDKTIFRFKNLEQFFS